MGEEGGPTQPCPVVVVTETIADAGRVSEKLPSACRAAAGGRGARSNWCSLSRARLPPPTPHRHGDVGLLHHERPLRRLPHVQHRGEGPRAEAAKDKGDGLRCSCPLHGLCDEGEGEQARGRARVDDRGVLAAPRQRADAARGIERQERPAAVGELRPVGDGSERGVDLWGREEVSVRHRPSGRQLQGLGHAAASVALLPVSTSPAPSLPGSSRSRALQPS